jgi:glycosyltransferase involved in cell wall biosynthesis
VKAQIPDVRLIVVGPTKYKKQFLSIIRDLGIEDNVILAGKVPREELPLFYSGCDVVAVPSLGGEGFPLVILEAMASGKPVIASRVGGIPEAITSGSNGILVDPGNVPQLTTALLELLGNENLRRKMGTRARLEAETKYDWKKIADQYVAEFTSIM